MRLFITEKPKQVQRLCEAMGGQWKKEVYAQSTSGGKTYSQSISVLDDNVIISCRGHMIRLCEPHEYDEKLKDWSVEHLPFYFDKLKFAEKPEAKSTLKKIKELLQKADEVVHVGDIDDEGQLLVDNILRFYNYKGKVYRLWYQNETVAGFKKALDDLQDNKDFESMGYRALARSYNDQLVGFNLTRCYTELKGEVTHIGRVKSPIINLVVMRDYVNENFKKTPYFYVSGVAQSAKLDKFKVEYAINEDDPTDEKGRINDENFANALVKQYENSPLSLISVEKAEMSQSAPMPFDANTLQQMCAKKLNFSGDKTMQIAQKLKDKDLISYHRTDTKELSYDNYLESADTLSALKESGMFDDLFKLVDGKKNHRAFAKKDSNKQFTHHGIIPLATVADDDLTDDELAVYKIIVESYLSLFMDDYKFIHYALIFKTKDGKCKFKARFRRVLNSGFKLAQKDDEDEEGENQIGGVIESLNENDIVHLAKLSNEKKMTKPPAIYTDASLLADIANAGQYSASKQLKEFFAKRAKENGGQAGGLGTPATVSGIVGELFEKGYLLKNGKKINASDKAKDLMKDMDGRLKYPDMTAVWHIKGENIKNMDDVMAMSKEIYDTMIVPIVNILKDEVSKNEQKYPTCPQCNNAPLKPTKKMSKDKKPYTLWSCSNKDTHCQSYFGKKDKNEPNFSAPLKKS